METFKKAFLTKYPDNKKVLDYFKEACGETPSWTTLTKSNIARWIEYMRQNVAPNSVRQYCAKVISVLNYYKDEVELPSGYEKPFKTVKSDASQQIYLTESEIDKIASYRPMSKSERSVRAQFLIACYTGMRHSDVVRLKKSNIVDGTLSYVSQKTRTKVSMPCKPIIASLISDAGIEVSDSTYNRTIRSIAREVGIDELVSVYRRGSLQEAQKWEFISSHTARRSFATNLYLRGCNPVEISRLMGHASIEMTNRYILGNKGLDEKAKSFFL